MGSIKDKIKVLKEISGCIKEVIFWSIRSFPSKKSFGKIGKHSILSRPCNIARPQNVYISDQVNIRYGINIINTEYEKVIIKKYSVIAPLCTIITNSHRATIGIPQFVLVESHINDKTGDVIIEEDVWIGARCTILAGVKIGRGATVGACALVTKDVPPYALVIGSPAKIAGVKFSKEGILNHEKALYAQEDRLSPLELDALFEKYYHGIKIFGNEEELNQKQQDIIKKIKYRHTL